MKILVFHLVMLRLFIGGLIKNLFQLEFDSLNEDFSVSFGHAQAQAVHWWS
jgi:hypothetical protein